MAVIYLIIRNYSSPESDVHKTFGLCILQLGGERLTGDSSRYTISAQIKIYREFRSSV